MALLCAQWEVSHGFWNIKFAAWDDYYSHQESASKWWLPWDGEVQLSGSYMMSVYPFHEILANKSCINHNYLTIKGWGYEVDK